MYRWASRSNSESAPSASPSRRSVSGVVSASKVVWTVPLSRKNGADSSATN
ncbi:hypothetical protein ACFQL1_17325 [Halomicroarcula sp. GCM10025709]|uniref:hypothetical protein n=1 Tax=Halomicroarcula sp. GCM10025709 TaxID=3252669 RepID=UPI00360616D1